MRLGDLDALKRTIEDRIDYVPSNDYDEGWNSAINTAIDEIDNAPTVTPTLRFEDITDEDIAKFVMIWQRATSKGLILEPERPHGEWEFVSRNCWKCPCCQELTNEGKNFCPTCGADLRGEDHD